MSARPHRDGTSTEPGAATPRHALPDPGAAGAVYGAAAGILAPAAAAYTVPRLLSVSTAAQLLGCSPRTVRRRIALGMLPAVREHGQVKLRADELAAYIESLERTGAPLRTRRAGKRRHDYSFLTE